MSFVTAAYPSASGGCRCRSGLTARQCCDLALTPMAGGGASADAAGVRGITEALRRGDRMEARRIAVAVLERNPRDQDALIAFAGVLKAEGAPAARIIAERVSALYPDSPVARAATARHLLEIGAVRAAEPHARAALRLAPLAPGSHLLMARVFLALDNAFAAERQLRAGRARLAPDAPSEAFDFQLAIALTGQGKFVEAREVFARLCAGAYRLDVLILWADMEEQDRKFTQAGALLDRAETLSPGHPSVARMRAVVLDRLGEREQALALIESEEQRPGAGFDPIRQRLKGQVLDRLGRYDEAFASFEALKRYQSQVMGLTYGEAEAGRLVSTLKRFYLPAVADSLPRATVASGRPQPLFVVGFPRSGTTLVEQMLASHPQVAGGGELPFILEAAQRSQTVLDSPSVYPFSLTELWLGDRAGELDLLRDLYLNRAQEMAISDPERAWFTDKMPLNETHLGLIHLLFPQSPVVHLLRHPLDVVLSVFFNGMTHGFNCAAALETAARHYVLIADLIQHYLSVLPVRYHAVRYEDLIDDQEGQARALLSFVGLPFDAEVLDFHRNPRAARTASYAQVTQPLYDRSRFRYRHYRKQLEPVIPILQPVIERLGYTI